MHKKPPAMSKGGGKFPRPVRTAPPPPAETPSRTSDRIGPEEGDALIEATLAAFSDRGGRCGAFAVAVSGGGDSLALMHLVSGWAQRLRRAPPSLHVLTVDHGLRPQSADEAKRVAAVARFGARLQHRHRPVD
mgnify:CR=1 FL=1